jgi:hypothetical protein
LTLSRSGGGRGDHRSRSLLNLNLYATRGRRSATVLLGVSARALYE